MIRKDFVKSLLAGVVAVPTLLAACEKEEIIPTTEGTGSGSGDCVVAPSETEGPFPTKNPSSFVRSDIRDGRAGYTMTADIIIGNTNNGCAALEGAIVDIWHCDAEGSYSEYGGTGMQSTSYQSVHFLRGRQVTDASGMVRFTTIFPGWYNGRSTHIHVHIYDASGKSLKVTQIAFPEGSGSAVVAVGGYGKGLSGYTYNSRDGIFRDDTTGVQIATVTGNTTDGFSLSIQLNVAA